MKPATTKASVTLPLDHPDVLAAIEKDVQAVRAAVAEVVERLRSEHAAELARLNANWTRQLTAIEKRAKAADESARELTKRVKAAAERLDKAAKAMTSAPPPATPAVKVPKPAEATTPKALRSARLPAGAMDVKGWLDEGGFETVDRRNKKGALWLMGSESRVKPALKEIKARFGVDFIYVAAGSSASGRRPAWYTLSKR